MIKNPLRKYLYYLHIWVGLVTAAILIIYLVTAVLLNHKGFFGAFETWKSQTITFDERQMAAGHEFAQARDELAAAMVKYTKKPQYDNIYVGGNGEAGFMDRSGKGFNFYVRPSGEAGVIRTGVKVQPWNFMNEQMHRNGGMTAVWRVLSSTLCVMAFIVLLAGFLILPWKRLEFILLLAGIALLAIGMWVATIPYHQTNAAMTAPASPAQVLYS
jgi:hypothetical protein